ncbi:hypothetical protein B0H13DRAFT_1925939 [Mycena leptocephala]|nr:hypothetical protein B0H13DRAFT_1925939 [Mycena leptocephala]
MAIEGDRDTLNAEIKYQATLQAEALKNTIGGHRVAGYYSKAGGVCRTPAARSNGTTTPASSSRIPCFSSHPSRSRSPEESVSSKRVMLAPPLPTKPFIVMGPVEMPGTASPLEVLKFHVHAWLPANIISALRCHRRDIRALRNAWVQTDNSAIKMVANGLDEAMLGGSGAGNGGYARNSWTSSGFPDVPPRLVDVVTLEGIQQPSMDWWTPGIFTWEERTPPVHLRTPLVVRSHEVLTGSPAIQMAGQSMNSEDNHPLQYYLFVFHKLVVQPVDHMINKSLLSRDLIRIGRMRFFYNEFTALAAKKGFNELASVTITDTFSTLLESDDQEADLSESNEKDIPEEAYLVEPLRSSVVTKSTGTLGSSGATGKLTSTVLAFSHFVMEKTACLLALADLQAVFRRSLCFRCPLTPCLQDPAIGVPWCYLIS